MPLPHMAENKSNSGKNKETDENISHMVSWWGDSGLLSEREVVSFKSGIVNINENDVMILKLPMTKNGKVKPPWA